MAAAARGGSSDRQDMSWINRSSRSGWLGIRHSRPAPSAQAKEADPKAQKGGQDDENSSYGVIYYPIKCPKCKSKIIKTYASKPPIRYHKCLKCGYRFRSSEAEGE